MTSQEARLARQKAATHARLASLRVQQRRIEAQQAALERRKRARRLTLVGTLAEAAGILWWDAGVLEKAFAALALQGTVPLGEEGAEMLPPPRAER